MGWLFSYKFDSSNAKVMHDCLLDLIPRLGLKNKNVKAFTS